MELALIDVIPLFQKPQSSSWIVKEDRPNSDFPGHHGSDARIAFADRERCSEFRTMCCTSTRSARQRGDIRTSRDLPQGMPRTIIGPMQFVTETGMRCQSLIKCRYFVLPGRISLTVPLRVRYCHVAGVG